MFVLRRVPEPSYGGVPGLSRDPTAFHGKLWVSLLGVSRHVGGASARNRPVAGLRCAESTVQPLMPHPGASRPGTLGHRSHEGEGGRETCRYIGRKWMYLC